MVNVLIIVWRESLEAMLVIGILAAWVSGRGGGVRAGLWAGVGTGIALALALAGYGVWLRLRAGRSDHVG